MLRTRQVKLPVDHQEEDLLLELTKRAGGIRPLDYTIVRRSIDARKKPDLFYSYTVDASFEKEKHILSKRNHKYEYVRRVAYQFPVDKTDLYSRDMREDITAGQKGMDDIRDKRRPVIIGAGPAGLFAGLMLARAGKCPLILERGDPVEEREKRTSRFFEEGILDPESNIQFGEGGAGTFSDGKLNTLVKDKTGRNRFILEELVKHGAPREILIDAKPHVGTDILKKVVASIREEIMSLGGEMVFRARLDDLLIKDGRVKGLVVTRDGQEQAVPCDQVILATGHSARDIFAMLHKKDVMIRPKAFAIGVRVEHPASMINISQYGRDTEGILPPADYKLTHTCSNGRSVYTFCMCPGGYVINASSEPGHLCVNGMSNHDRGGRNSNSAVITTVGPADFGSDHPLAGVEFQRKYEQLAYFCARGKIPVQLFGDFLYGRTSVGLGDVEPDTKGDWNYSNLHLCLPEYVCDSIAEGIQAFGRKIEGYDRPDAVMCGVETRTSSPIRIERDESCQSNIRGLYPCGEGAGYAGGIMSAAMDGIRCAEAVVLNNDG